MVLFTVFWLNSCILVWLQVAGAGAGVHIIPKAFPALHHLQLTYVHLGEGALFDMLGTLAKPTLNSLVLYSCIISNSAIERAAAALATLSSLGALQLEQSDMMRLAAQVTGLTSLVGDWATPSLDEQLMLLASHNTQLQRLVMRGSGQAVSADHLQRLLVSCPGLTELELDHRGIEQDGLDALLTHGTSITHLTLSSISLTASKTHVPCSWKVLELIEPSLQQLAYLPLSSVHHLTTGSKWTPFVGWLQVLLAVPNPPSQLLSLLSQAASNLAACPACTKHKQQFVGLHLAGASIAPQQCVHLFEALALLRVMHLERLSIMSQGLQLGSSEVEALAHSLGDSIKSVELAGCTLLSSFWRPLAQRLPHLQRLTLESGVGTSANDLSCFLTLSSHARPAGLTLSIRRGVLGDRGVAELQAHIAAWQLQNIRLVCM
jgi:hypothetical protein